MRRWGLSFVAGTVSGLAFASPMSATLRFSVVLFLFVGVILAAYAAEFTTSPRQGVANGIVFGLPCSVLQAVSFFTRLGPRLHEVASGFLPAIFIHGTLPALYFLGWWGAYAVLGGVVGMRATRRHHT